MYPPLRVNSLLAIHVRRKDHIESSGSHVAHFLPGSEEPSYHLLLCQQCNGDTMPCRVDASLRVTRVLELLVVLVHHLHAVGNVCI